MHTRFSAGGHTRAHTQKAALENDAVLRVLLNEADTLQHICDVINPPLLHAKLFRRGVQIQYSILRALQLQGTK